MCVPNSSAALLVRIRLPGPKHPTREASCLYLRMHPFIRKWASVAQFAIFDSSPRKWLFAQTSFCLYRGGCPHPAAFGSCTVRNICSFPIPRNYFILRGPRWSDITKMLIRQNPSLACSVNGAKTSYGNDTKFFDLTVQSVMRF